MEMRKILMNYALSIGFIFLTVLFLTALFGMTRFVLDGASPLQDHVLITKDLLEDVNEVERATEVSSNVTYMAEPSSFFSFNASDVRVESTSYRNLRDNRSVFTFIFEKSMNKEGSYYYFEVSNYSSLVKGQPILYSDDLKVGIYNSYDEDMHFIYDVENEDYTRIEGSQIKGIVFYKE